MPGNDAFTTLLLHMDGTNLATTFPDASSSAHTVTANGGAKIQTATSQFGGASGLFASATTDSLSVTGTLTDFAWASDFTVDFWLNTATKTADTQQRHILSGGNAANSFFIAINSSGFVNVGDDSVGAILTGTTDVSSATWIHAAIARSGSTNRLFINGAQEGGNVTNSQSWAVASTLTIGKFASGNGRYNGSLDELRISKGIARWTANFTPPTGPYDNQQLFNPWPQLAPILAS